MSSFTLGIDYGTGGAKACLINDQFEVLGYSFSEYPIIQQEAGWSEHDPHKYWSICCNMIQDCIAQAGIAASEIAAVCVSSALPCQVMLDREGNPVNNAYNLMDRRAVKEVEVLKEILGEKEAFRISANRLDDHPTLARLIWERNNRAGDFARIDKVFTIEGFINYRLTGIPSLVHQNAVFHGPVYNIAQKRYENSVFEKLDLDSNLFPPLYFCDEFIGEVTARAVRETGLAAGTPILAGQADFNAACCASGVIREGDVQMNLGTCGNFGIIHKDTDFLFEMLALGFTVGCRDTYITIPTTTTGGMSLRYLRDLFTEQLGGMQLPDEADAYDLLTKEAESVPAGSEGLLVLPYLMGERTPIWDAQARGCLFGLSLNHKRGHIVRAMMEGVAYAMYNSFEIIRESGRLVNAPLVMHEGGARSSLWRRIITDVFSVPTANVEDKSGAPKGDALLAGIATGIFDGFEIAREKARYVDVMEPSQRSHDRYMEYFGLYKELYRHLSRDYKRLAQIRESGREQAATGKWNLEKSTQS